MSGAVLVDRWPILGRHEGAAEWLGMRADAGLAERTLDAYGRGLAEYLQMCEQMGVDPLVAGRGHVAGYVRVLRERRGRCGAKVVSLDSGAGLSNATLQQRMVPVRLFYDYLVEEGRRESNPVGRGRYSPGHSCRGQRHGLVPRLTKLPWIPSEPQWSAILQVARAERVRNRLMLALAYDGGLRREELCSLRTDDLDPGQRMVRIRAETTKTRRERIVPYSVATAGLLGQYLLVRQRLSRARGPLLLSESRRNRAEPITQWSWSKIVRRIALEAEVPGFSTHTLRHLCLTDLARAGWELHTIAAFAGHRDPTTTLQYVHLSGRELAEKLQRGMHQIHTWRVETIARLETPPPMPH